MLISTPVAYFAIGFLVLITFGAIWRYSAVLIENEELRRANKTLLDVQVENKFKIEMTDYLEREFRKVFHAAGYNPDNKSAEERLEAIRIAGEAAFRKYDARHQSS